ncbi:uncharacterized protein BO95DRAFT_440160 [Aspergillus brunneoviolaceus CBS 621.78]|uniref:Uncharacterized protein n=1 Tax=Aspergillus brunneoviolaceus CBS 621.78 TaxID=1450534 RepID=A0ACD1GHN2_9EURO|nr:hypothetical protein BO95DRAFT_440160 [Aspergillus brunneoviolaceus CBS 621.78]RAH48670.1 hypothetical protein BO95DRAFT_440160 [Aspergillus brunneoviolaceus CBS 621.78]
MDPFSTLPHELLSSISEDAADWVGLDSLIRVSPRIAALFTPEGGSDQAHSDAIYLVENILRTNPMMSHQLHRFFRMCADLRSLPFTSGCNLTLAEFMAQDYSSPLSPTSVTGTVLRDMVRVAANIQRLACACLTTFLARTRAVQPIGYGRDAAGRLKGEEPYPPQEAGPPSWAEEYRVYRALWHLQLYSDVWKVVPQIGWSLSELHLYLRVSDFDIPSERPERGPTQDGDPTGDEMRAVSECLQDICPHPNLSEPLSANLDSFYLRLWLELPDALSLRRQDPQGSDDSQASAFRSFGVWSSPPLPSPEEDTCKPVLGQWGNTICAVQERNIGNLWMMLPTYEAYERPAMFQTGSLLDPRPLLGLGLVFWDRWRLYNLGLWSASPSNGQTRKNCPIVTGPDGSQVPVDYMPRLKDGRERNYRWSEFAAARLAQEEQEARSSLAA